MPPISKPEQRFKAETGIRFLMNGKVRCHGLAKSKMRRWREEFEDYKSPADDLWPECQCHKPAVEGQYVCNYHGGSTPRIVNPPRTILDVMPLDMAEKYRAVMQSPDYISRKDDINLVQVRIMMLMEELEKEADSEEMWGLISEAITSIKQGDTINALDYLQRASKSRDNKKEVWKEFYQAEKLLADLTTTQMKTAKDLQSMATIEQVSALMATLISMINSGAQTYIPNPTDRSKFTRAIVEEIQRLTGTTPKEILVEG